MKRTSFVLSVVAVVAFSSQAGGAAPFSVDHLEANLTLRPGVAQAGHPAVRPAGLYGAFDGDYDTRASTLRYTLEYKGLRGTVFRVLIRSRTTGATFAVLCSPCSQAVRARAGNEGLPVTRVVGNVTLDPDIGFLITHGRSFVQVDTTAYPWGEIGGRILRQLPALPFTGPGPPRVQETPRCC